VDDLTTSVLGVTLPLPVMNAPGVFGTPRELTALLGSRVGAIMLPTVTVRPFVHAEFRSLHNPGYDKLIPLTQELVERAGGRPVVASIAGGTSEEYAHLARAFADAGAALVEANFADPWIGATLAPFESAAQLREVCGVLVAGSPVPVLVRLPESVNRLHRPIAEALRSAGVRGVVVKNDFVDFEKFLLEAGGDFDVVVVGGAGSGFDVHRVLAKGAKAVELDAPLAVEGPGVFARLERELRHVRGERPS
jgi:dihydroorotate dehydrogenase